MFSCLKLERVAKFGVHKKTHKVTTNGKHAIFSRTFFDLRILLLSVELEDFQSCDGSVPAER